MVVFPCPASPLTKFASVSGVLTPLLSQTETSVTFSVAPANLTSVQVFYGNDIVVPPGLQVASNVSAVMSAPPADKGLTLFLSVTSGSGTLTCKVQQFDPVSASWFDMTGAAFAQVTGPTNLTLTIFPGASAVANTSVNGTIRNQYRVNYTITGAGFTFSIGAQTY